ncbi:MAG: hypothetical protein IPL99_02625 [Candidatus Competibacteraceae bacterium]|nr:hypothetical protein [Candidatus Competibacteraceae bacterium]
MNTLLNRWLPLVLVGLITWAVPPMAPAQPSANKDKIALVMKVLSNPFFSNRTFA